MTNEEIVAALAALDPESFEFDMTRSCFFCKNSPWDLEDVKKHAPDCLWRAAKEAIERER